MTMSLSTGLISGMDTGALVSQLIAAEAAPQTALKARLKSAQSAASAYRTVNTTFARRPRRRRGRRQLDITERTDRRELEHERHRRARRPSATKGSKVTFTVTALRDARRRSSPATRGPRPTDDVRLHGAGPAHHDLRRAERRRPRHVSIPAAPRRHQPRRRREGHQRRNLGLSAAVSGPPSEYKLQLTSAKDGAAGACRFVGCREARRPAEPAPPRPDARIRTATLDLGGGSTAKSGSNTFADLITGVSVHRQPKAETVQTTVSVGSDPDAVRGKMQTLVDAVNAALNTVQDLQHQRPGQHRGAQGRLLGDQLAGAAAQRGARAPSGADGSPAQTVGFQLTKDGKVTFDKAKFLAALKATPSWPSAWSAARRPAPDAGARRRRRPPVSPTRLLDVAKSASDSATGSLVKLAEGRESTLKGIQDRIDAWDLRLAKRKETLTRQFTAMETSLSSLRNQSTWLAGQINSLPSG